MDELLKVVVVVFMFFMCIICLFAVVVIVRDIVHESAKSRRGRKDEEDSPAAPAPHVAAPVVLPAEAPQPVVVQPAVIEPLPVEEPVIAPVPAVEVETAAAVAEEDPDAVSFSRGSLTMEEKYGTLSTEFKRYFDDIVRHATSKSGVKELKRGTSYDYKIGAYRVVRLMIKRSEIVCEFTFIDREFNSYANESNVRIKQAATTVRVSEASAVGVVKDGIDLVCQQIAEDKERKEQIAREKRKERRRLAKEQEQK